MKTGLIAVVILVSFITGYCQDTLHTKSRYPFPVKVLEVGEKQIKYKDYTNPEGPDYVINRNQVIKIVYQNGKVDFLNEVPPKNQQVKSKPYPWLKGHNTFNLLLTDFLFSIATIYYERTFLADHLGIRIPFSVGFNASGSDSSFIEYKNGLIFPQGQQKGYYSKNKIFSTGVEVLIYPFKPGKANYFVGTAYGYGEFNYWVDYTVFNANFIAVTRYKKAVMTYNAFMIKNGIDLRPAKHLSINMSFAMGFQQLNLKNSNDAINNAYYPEYSLYRSLEANIGIGYRF